MKDIATPVAITRHWSAEDLPAAVSVDTGKATLPMKLFVGVVVIHVALSLCLQPTWLWSGQMWAEMATNFYANAEWRPLTQSIFVTDAGYIPLPARMIATTGRILRLPAVAIPYFYTWSALLISATMVASFCLPAFRRLIPNDWLRFVATLVMSCVGDFEVRTFINFSNYAAFPILAVAALSVADRGRTPPAWSWLLPLFMISKPAMLATVPAVMAAAYWGGPRWRTLSFTSLALAGTQVVQLLVSHASGSDAAFVGDSSLAMRLLTLWNYFFCVVTCFCVGRWVPLQPAIYAPMAFVVFGAVAWCLRASTPHVRMLVICSLLAVFGNVAINCIGAGGEWGPNLVGFSVPTVNRRTMVAFAGALLVLTGVISTVTQDRVCTRRAPIAGAAVFIIWFMISGWFAHGLRAAREPLPPVLGNSHWQEMAAAVDAKDSVFSVPIDPWGWAFCCNCRILANESPRLWPHIFKGVPIREEGCIFDHIAPPEVVAGELYGIAVLLRPKSQARTRVEAMASLTTGDGKTVKLRGMRDIACAGGVMLIGAERDLLVSDVRKIALSFNVPVEIAHNTDQDAPFLCWLGREKHSDHR